MKNTNILLCSFIFTSLLSNAEEYTVDTVTRNNWKTIKINDDLDIVKKNGGKIIENNDKKIKYECCRPRILRNITVKSEKSEILAVSHFKRLKIAKFEK